MRTVKIVLVCILFVGVVSVNGQTLSRLPSTITLPNYNVEVSTGKIITLLFPYKVMNASVGSADVQVQWVKGAKNVLQLQAARPNFKETNLSALTEDGQVYPFILRYAEEPKQLTICFLKDSLFSAPVIIGEPSTNPARIEAKSKWVAEQEKFINSVKDKKYGMKLKLSGIYLDDEVMYFQMDIKNRTNIRYDIAQWQFYIRDFQKSKRTAVQEKVITPLYMGGNTKIIEGKSSQKVVIALPKFTIPDNKYFSLLLMEQNGGRHLSIRVSNQVLVEAKQL